MSHLVAIVKRELNSYFVTHLAYVFILIFLILSGVFTFYLGNFFERRGLLPFGKKRWAVCIRHSQQGFQHL